MQSFIKYGNKDTPHLIGIEIWEFVNSNCNKWIGCSGTVDWLANSPDVRPCDFSLWAINCEWAFILYKTAKPTHTKNQRTTCIWCCQRRYCKPL